MMLHRVIVHTVLSLLTLTYAAVPLSDFFPFGPKEDTQLHHNDDEFSPPINLSINFTFFTEHHSRLYVNTNGILSFYSGVYSYGPVAFPQIGNMVVLAPFWAHIDTTRCTTDCDIWYRESNCAADLEKASLEIKKYFKVMKNFQATWAFVATWFDVPEWGDFPIKKRNTFQSVLTTNGESTFVIYYYNKIQWIGTHYNAQVGFNMGDDIHYFSVDGSRSSKMIDLPLMSNVGSPGTFVFRVDLKEIKPAPKHGDLGHCYLKAADIALVVDLSLSINNSQMKNLVADLVKYLPINDYEFKLAMTSFSTVAENEFDFDEYVNKTDIIRHIAKLNHTSGGSNLQAALGQARKLFRYDKGSRPYARKFVLIFTDGLMLSSHQLITEVTNLQNMATVVSIATGASVRHEFLKELTKTVYNILRPSPDFIWRFLRYNNADPGCLECLKHSDAKLVVLLDDTSEMKSSHFSAGKTFVLDLFQNMESHNLNNTKQSVDVFGSDVKNVVSMQDLASLEGRIGLLSVRDYEGSIFNQTSMVDFVTKLSENETSHIFFIFISNGFFLDSIYIKQIKAVLMNKHVTVISVGVGFESNWDNLEDLATSGYFVFDIDDANVTAEHLKKEIEEIKCV